MRIALFITSLLFSVAACSQEAMDKDKTKTEAKKPAETTYFAGKDYEVLAQPVKTIIPGKIEVTEVFAYSCGHCYQFESKIGPWKKTMPKDVALVQNPAMWRKTMEPHARIVYAAKALNVFDKVHPAAFKAIHVDRKQLQDIDEIAKLFTDAGVEKEKFLKVYNSFGVKSQVQQADSRVRALKVSGTPEMFVDGRYRVTTRMVGTHDNMLKVVDFLIKKVRDEK